MAATTYSGLMVLNFYCPVCSMVRGFLIDEADNSATCCFCGDVSSLRRKVQLAREKVTK